MNTLQDNDWLRVVPLGGLGHIGGNMMVYETAQDLIMVDAGVLFPTTDQPGIDYVIPDIAYVLEPSRRHKLRGIILTHGHEDHIGALPYVLPELGSVPLWATPFTAALIRNKLGEFPEVKFDLEASAVFFSTSPSSNAAPLPIESLTFGALLPRQMFHRIFRCFA